MCDKPITKAEIGKGIQEIIPPGTKVEFSPQNEIELLKPWVDKVLEAIGVSSAWVSDRSILGDFFSRGDSYDQKVQAVADALGLPDLSGSDYIYEVARRLRDRELH